MYIIIIYIDKVLYIRYNLIILLFIALGRLTMGIAASTIRKTDTIESNVVSLEPSVIDMEPAELFGLLSADQVVLVDVRETAEFEHERIPGALLMPLSFLEASLFPHIPGKQVVLHCAVGARSAAAGKQLLQAGHARAIHLKGGLKAWKEQGFPTEK